MYINVFCAKAQNYRCASLKDSVQIYFFAELGQLAKPNPHLPEYGFCFSSPSWYTAHHPAKRICQNGSFAQKNPAKANKKVEV
jgi:hypothetical protein